MNHSKATAREIKLSELHDLIENHENVLIVDVREREEYARGHIPGALPIPIGALEHATDTTSVACNHDLALARTSTVVVCCDDERRSRVAAARLDKLGFTEGYFLAGGLKHWKSGGFPLLSG